MALTGLTVFGAFTCFYVWLTVRWFGTRLKLRPRIQALALADAAARPRAHGTAKNRPKRTYLRKSIRIRKFNEGLPAMLEVVGNSLKVGHSFAQAIHLVAEDLDGPISQEMKQLEHDVQVGFSMEDALDRAYQRTLSEDFGLVVTAIKIQRQVGGNLAEVLEKVASTIRDRIRIEREVKMLTAQGRFSATIFMLLPVCVGVLLFIVNPTYMTVLVTSSLGRVLLIVAFIGQVIGFLFIRKIIRVTL